MAITVKEVLDRKLFNGMKAVAGLAGLQAVITWVNIMEIPDSPDTINRGEFLITTGYGLENEEKYHNLIQRLKARGVPAVAVQTGYYVSAIPDYLIRSADEYEMPLLEMPANYSFSNILQAIFRRPFFAAGHDFKNLLHRHDPVTLFVCLENGIHTV